MYFKMPIKRQWPLRDGKQTTWTLPWWFILCVNLAGPWFLDIWSNIIPEVYYSGGYSRLSLDTNCGPFLGLQPVNLSRRLDLPKPLQCINQFLKINLSLDNPDEYTYIAPEKFMKTLYRHIAGGKQSKPGGLFQFKRLGRMSRKAILAKVLRTRWSNNSGNKE